MTSLRDHAGPYRLLEEIGVGGMGEVHLALDAGGRTVAVKVLHPVIARDEVARRRLEREVATMRRVHSPYVAQILDADFAARRPYIVTRYVQGRSLDERVRAGGPLRGGALLRVARGLARAMYAIHEAGVVHRDFKPANVILVEQAPVVIDFGLAHVLDATRLTRTGTAIGTPGYLAPEILDDGPSGPAADVFSWGATVAFAAGGRSPYGAGPAQAVFSRVLRGRHELGGVPGDLRPVVEAALSVDPDDRPGTGEILEELAEIRTRLRRAAESRRPGAHPHTGTRPPQPADPYDDTPPRQPGESRTTNSPDARHLQSDEAASYETDAGTPPPHAGGRAPAPGGAWSDDEALTAPDDELLRDAEAASAVPRPTVAGVLRAILFLALPVGCYTLPVIAVAVTLTACAAAYTWDALAGAYHRMAAVRRGRLARAGAGLAALVTVPAQTVLRLVVLLLALVLGYSGVLGATYWFVAPHGRALALPLGVLAVVAGMVRAWYSSEARAARLCLSVVAAGLLAGAIAGIPYPAWWPLVLS